MNELRLCLLNTIHLKYIVGVSETMLFLCLCYCFSSYELLCKIPIKSRWSLEMVYQQKNRCFPVLRSLFLAIYKWHFSIKRGDVLLIPLITNGWLGTQYQSTDTTCCYAQNLLSKDIFETATSLKMSLCDWPKISRTVWAWTLNYMLTSVSSDV